MLKLAYNTNGFLAHRLEDAIALLAEMGYAGISITLDVHHLPPFDTNDADLARTRKLLDKHGLACALETGGRFILDPRHKHLPNLLSTRGSEQRLRFLERAIDMADAVGAGVVSIWSGRKEDGMNEDEAYDRLAGGLDKLRAHARGQGVVVAFEPEPGMLVESLADLRRLEKLLGVPLPLTLDIGHLLLTESEPIAEIIHTEAERLANVHIEDMRSGKHEHLPFGEGEIDFPPVLAALSDTGYKGLVSVELSRSSHEAPDRARRSLEFLQDVIAKNVEGEPDTP
jgi:sugar phosphate isomerase/epimerase